MSNEPKILYFDIETSLIKVEFNCFQLKQYTNYIPATAIKQDFYIIGGAWQWVGTNKKGKVSVLDAGNKDMNNDKHVVKTLRDLVEQADIVVYHNGDKFDLKKLNSRIMVHRISPLPNNITSIDTYKAAKKVGNFTSNRMDYLCKVLGLEGKIETSHGLWERALEGDKKAIKEMMVYCEQDVKVGVGLYLAMKPYIKHPNLNLFRKGYISDLACDTCGGSHLHSRGLRVTATKRYARVQCQDCGHWQQSKPSDLVKVK